MATILIVDDEPDVCDVMTRLFQKWGWSSECITNPRDVHQFVKDRRPDVVLLDIMMPGLNGFSVLSAIRGDSEIATTPVILYSALNDEKTLHAALDAGADDYIVKGTAITKIRERVGLYVA